MDENIQNVQENLKKEEKEKKRKDSQPKINIGQKQMKNNIDATEQ